MITYEYFLNKLNLPTMEEFDEIINNIPSFDELNDSFEYDPEYDNLPEQLINYGVLNDFNYTYVEDCDYDNKKIEIGDIANLAELNEINDLFKSYGWTMINYDNDLEYFLKQESEKNSEYEKQILLNKLDEIATIEQLKMFLENVKQTKCTE